MEYKAEKREIVLNRELNKLDRLVLDFSRILEKHVDYVIISGYISIILGRTRATEDVDIFIRKITKDEFLRLYDRLIKGGFWCLNAEEGNEVFNYLEEGCAVRFAKKGKIIPNFEIKFPKRKIDEETFNDFIIVVLREGKIRISSLERQIAFKRYFLKSGKDIEDAVHIEELFKNKLDYEKINKLKERIENIENET